MEVLADGTLDFPDELLATFDIVIASVHTSLRQPREQVTQRMLNAIQNPHVDIIAHPSGRLIGRREPADLDMDRILEAALEHGTILEINSNPDRLDLNDIYARRAAEMGILLSINTDAHRPEHLVFRKLGGWSRAPRLGHEEASGQLLDRGPDAEVAKSSRVALAAADRPRRIQSSR